MQTPVPVLTAILATLTANLSLLGTLSALAESDRPTYSLRSSRTAGSLDRVEVIVRSRRRAERWLEAASYRMGKRPRSK